MVIVNRRSFPTGHARAALLKAMLRVLSAHGRDTHAFLAKLRVTADDLEDETKPVPLTAVAEGARGLIAACGSGAIAEMTEHMLENDHLGVWMPMLRGTVAPHDLFRRLEAADSEFGRTTRWETIESLPGRWVGRVHISHDTQLERDGVLSQVRQAEIACIPQLFGHRPVKVKRLDDDHLTQTFRAEWPLPNAVTPFFVGVPLGAAIGLVVALLVRAEGASAALFVLAFGAVGALAVIARWREVRRRVQAGRDALRVRALERSLHLRELAASSHGSGLVGSVVAGQYRIVRRMGSGASGVIYEALRITDGLPVALKLLRAVAVHDNVASDRLRREAEALGLAWHPNVVEVVDFGSLPDGTSYLVMELLHGETLAQRLRADSRLSTEQAARIGIELCDALAAVHAAGIVHRDIKPSNLFLVAESGADKVKLIDFGIARVEWEETRITQTGGPLGTSGYMSPEQESGGPLDARSDLFAVGALLYECLTGDPPPPRSPSGHASASRSSGVQRAARPLPPEWNALIERALALDPAARFGDARAFANALRDLRVKAKTDEASGV
jgi:serine/threonine-protein kinase